MRFLFKIKLFGRFQFSILVSTTQSLGGITSRIVLKNGEVRHFYMADLENCTEEQAESSLRFVQAKYGLGDIEMWSDSENSYRAICFSQLDFRTFVKALFDTEYLDYSFLWWTLIRGKATIRLSDKHGRPSHRCVKILKAYPVSLPERTKLEFVVYDTGTEKKGRSIILGGEKHG